MEKDGKSQLRLHVFVDWTNNTEIHNNTFPLGKVTYYTRLSDITCPRCTLLPGGVALGACWPSWSRPSYSPTSRIIPSLSVVFPLTD